MPSFCMAFDERMTDKIFHFLAQGRGHHARRLIPYWRDQEKYEKEYAENTSDAMVLRNLFRIKREERPAAPAFKMVMDFGENGAYERDIKRFIDNESLYSERYMAYADAGNTSFPGANFYFMGKLDQDDFSLSGFQGVTLEILLNTVEERKSGVSVISIFDTTTKSWYTTEYKSNSYEVPKPVKRPYPLHDKYNYFFGFGDDDEEMTPAEISPEIRKIFDKDA